ncbi:MAG TPA: peptidoglycan-binding domain-containing protein, partial [Chthoniobacterales bacterium]
MHSRILIVLLALVAVAAKPVVKKAETEGPRPSPKPKASVAPAIPVALPNYDEETSVKLQIFLDNNYFGPGKIDGRMGEFFRKALVHYKRAHGMAETGAVDSWLIDQVPETYTNYTIPEEALGFVGETKSKPSEQAKLKRMHYGSLLELVAERYHSAEEFLKKLNPGMNLEELKPGDTVKVPNVLPFKIEDLKPGFAEKNPEFANRKIYIDT